MHACMWTPTLPVQALSLPPSPPAADVPWPPLSPMGVSVAWGAHLEEVCTGPDAGSR